MRREQIKVEVIQQIRYADSQELEEYRHQTPAILLELQSYSKITYQDANQQTVEVKWSVDSEDTVQVEITQPDYRLTFHPTKETATFYQTPQGLWELQVLTKQIQWHFAPDESGKAKQQGLTIDYQLKKSEEILGNYRFRLIYLV